MAIETIIFMIVTAAATGGAVYFAVTKSQGSKKDSKNEPKPVVNNQDEIMSAQNEAKKIVLDAKDEAIKIKERADSEATEVRRRTSEAEKKADSRMDEVLSKLKEVENRERNARAELDKWKRRNTEIEQLRQEQIEKLQSISSLTKKEAQELIMSNLEKSMKLEIVKRIKEAEEEIKAKADQTAKEILVDAMHQASTDYVPEYTISTVKLTDPDVKGRIIGKEGRNIRAFEDTTGVNVDFENEDEVRLSSFDAVRREVARRSMEQLIKDGRIHPARIEEIVKKNEDEVDKIILQAGEDLCQKVGVYNLPQELAKKLGTFKFRTSYGQNMIQHTLEETRIGVKIASEIGADVTITKLACLLHDIGKVITDKDGNHIELGAEYLKKFKLPQSVIAAVAEHHNDKPSTVEGVIVQIADSISGSRPGARYEDFENFVKRMHGLEEVAMSFEGVDKAFAISAGRELRVIVKPEDISDADAVKLGNDIAQKVENELTYPGTVKIIVIRELRTLSTAS